MIKTSYDFTINSSLLFNRFSESLSSLYEKKLSEDEYSGKALNKALSLATNVRFKDDFTEEEISNARESIPSSLDETKNSITFNPEKHTIRLNTIIRDGKRIVPRRNLGGSAKGFATKKVAEYFEKVYPGISLMINSGSSSILAVGSRPDDKPWKISYTNPVYKEQRRDGKRIQQRGILNSAVLLTGPLLVTMSTISIATTKKQKRLIGEIIFSIPRMAFLRPSLIRSLSSLMTLELQTGIPLLSGTLRVYRKPMVYSKS